MYVRAFVARGPKFIRDIYMSLTPKDKEALLENIALIHVIKGRGGIKDVTIKIKREIVKSGFA